MSATPTTDESGNPADWTRSPERSNAFALRLMTAVALACGRRIARIVLHPISLYFVLFSPSARRQSARYLQRALGRSPTWGDLYRHVHTFSSVILDRVYLLRGSTGLFDITLHGTEVADGLNRDGRGAFLVGAHVGSFEVLRALGETRRAQQVAMVMYLENARLINDAFRAIAPDAAPKVIALGRSGSMLEVRDWLDSGGVAGILADRALPNESMRAGQHAISFLGHPAPFADGPFRLAAMLKRRVVFMAGVYVGGNRYDVSFHELADFSAPGLRAEGRDLLVRQALERYVAHLETVCRAHPMNWFNFHDFWREDAARVDE